MRVVVTRPVAQAAEWVARLRSHAIDAVALPLIGIEAPADVQAVRATWAQLARRRLVVFVSPNAVEQFFAARPAECAWPADTLAGSIGPGTTRALQAHGVAAAAIVAPAEASPQFDSEALWAALASREWRGAEVLIVRGDGGRDWLADTLRAHGARVEPLAAYRRAAPSVGAVERELLRQASTDPARHLWFFSSSEAIDNLAALEVASDWAAARAIATHPRIAARARRLGIGRVAEARPGFDAVVACIQSFEP